VDLEIIRSRNPKIVAFPASALGVVAPANPAAARAVFGANPDVMLAVDGPMFEYCEGQPHDYAVYTCGTVRYLLQDNLSGVSVPGLPGYEDKGITISVVGGTAIGSLRRSPVPGASVAIQLSIGLVEDGAIGVRDHPPDDPSGQNDHRLAVGIMPDGKIAFAYARAPVYEFAVMLRDAGMRWAGYTDGGGSSSLVMRKPDGSLEGTDADDPDGRRVPSWIVARVTPDVWQESPERPQIEPQDSVRYIDKTSFLDDEENVRYGSLGLAAAGLLLAYALLRKR